MPPVTRIGLTGGIGSGKSTVAGMLSNLGAAVVDADAISRQSTGAGGFAIPAIRQTFGERFITPEGAMDRDAMRAEVFANPLSRRSLEAIIHPLVAQETRRQEQQALDEGRHVIVFDVPLLVESSHWRQRVDWVMVVDCTPEIQIQRVSERSGLPPAETEKIMASQSPRDARLKAADIVVCNTHFSLNLLNMEVADIASRFGL